MQVDVAAVMVVYCKCGWKRVQPSLHAGEEFIRHRQACKMYYFRRGMLLAGIVEDPPFARPPLVGLHGFDPVPHTWENHHLRPSYEIIWRETMGAREDDPDDIFWVRAMWPNPGASVPS